MLLSHLPLELLHEVLSWSIQVRGIKRGLQLRLISKLFAREVLTTLALYKLLDSYFHPIPIGEDDPSICSVATAYLERRVLSERKGGSPVLLRVRDVALRLQEEGIDGRTEQKYITQLCPLVIDTCKVRLGSIWAADNIVPESEEILLGKDLDTDVYIAALYTKTWSVVSKRMDRRENMNKRSLIFGDARDHAAKHAGPEVLTAIMDARHESDFQTVRLYLLDRTAWYGRLEAAQYVFESQATSRPWKFAREKSRPLWPRHNEQGLAQLHTPSKEVFDFITEKRGIYCTGRTFGAKENTVFLLYCARHGWTEMAIHYIALGASVDGSGVTTRDVDGVRRPILAACENGHEEIVRVLLANGVSTSQPALETAVRYGHFPIVFLLLEHGAEVGRALVEAVAKGYNSVVLALLHRSMPAKSSMQSLLVHAIKLENKALFELLLHYAGTTVEKSAWTECLSVASKQGLDSMSKMLVSMQANLHGGHGESTSS